jgi:hypothetical protein
MSGLFHNKATGSSIHIELPDFYNTVVQLRNNALFQANSNFFAPQKTFQQVPQVPQTAQIPQIPQTQTPQKINPHKLAPPITAPQTKRIDKPNLMKKPIQAQPLQQPQQQPQQQLTTIPSASQKPNIIKKNKINSDEKMDEPKITTKNQFKNNENNSNQITQKNTISNISFNQEEIDLNLLFGSSPPLEPITPHAIPPDAPLLPSFSPAVPKPAPTTKVPIKPTPIKPKIKPSPVKSTTQSDGFTPTKPGIPVQATPAKPIPFVRKTNQIDQTNPNPPVPPPTQRPRAKQTPLRSNTGNEKSADVKQIIPPAEDPNSFLYEGPSQGNHAQDLEDLLGMLDF